MAIDFSSYIERFKSVSQKVIASLQGYAFKEKSDKKESLDSESSNSLCQVLFGGIGALGEDYFPSDLIGGCCPRIAGEELDTVWNAAAEAADTERLHVVWQSRGDKVWYLAVRSSEMSSHPNTWCPFASLLPGTKDVLAVPPACYTFFSDEIATMMTVTEDSLQIHRGTSSIIRAKAEKLSREFGHASIVELVPDVVAKLTPVPWYSVSLFEERARRILSVVSVSSAILLASLMVVVWFFVAMSMIGSRVSTSAIKEHTKEKSLQLMQNVQSLRSSSLREQVAKFADTNDGLLALSGFLEIYQIKDKKVYWRAMVPSNITSDRIQELGAQTMSSDSQGVVIGFGREPKKPGSR